MRTQRTALLTALLLLAGATSANADATTDVTTATRPAAVARAATPFSPLLQAITDAASERVDAENLARMQTTLADRAYETMATRDETLSSVHSLASLTAGVTLYGHVYNSLSRAPLAHAFKLIGQPPRRGREVARKRAVCAGYDGKPQADDCQRKINS